jgi:hypothetical protein
MTDVKEVLPHVKIRVNPHISFTRGHEGRDMQDPPGSQVVKLVAIAPQERAKKLV